MGCAVGQLLRAPFFNFMVWGRFRSKNMSSFTGPHRWIKGEWGMYGDYIHRDDVCSCGCVRRVVETQEGDRVADFYEKDNDVSISPPACKKKNMLSVEIVADPTHPKEEYKQQIKLHIPVKIDYFDLYKQ